ncbi:MAG: DUF1292 domain-containing protein [Oscillospiraceae bacterium]|nr:DUF1292 domain-containing protein [Oscillospiraceae bacterium]
MFKDNKFTVMAGGKEVVCDVLFTFHSKETGKDYLAFTDHSKDRSGNPSVFYGTYDPDAADISLAPIQTPQEWAMVRDMMNTLHEEAMTDMRKKLMEAHQAQQELAEKEKAEETEVKE